MTTIQKFQELTGPGGGPRRGQVHPTLSEAANIFVMVDEAHRTQYQSLAANMRQALPNACFLGFTGTPIDKKDRSTLRTFGSYIDTYTIEQAVQDKATVPIFYESRLAELQIIGQTIDQVFDRVFADRSEEERAVIKRRFATEQAIAGAPRRIEAICLDLIEHFNQFIAPNGFKAQVVATSRHAAVSYKDALDRLNGPESALIMSAVHNDEERLTRWHLSKEEQDRVIERFKDHDDPLAMLVVCDMLLTGVRRAGRAGHVSRRAAQGAHPAAGHRPREPPARGREDLRPGRRLLGRVREAAGGARHLLDHGDPGGVDPERRRAAAAAEPACRGDEVLPVGGGHQRPGCLRARAGAGGRPRRVRPRLPPLQPVHGHAAARPARPDVPRRPALAGQDPGGPPAPATGTTRLDLSGCGEKVRQLIADAVVADGIEILVKEVQLFSPEFDEKVEALQSDDAKASEMEHAIRHEINVRVEENPAFYQSLRQRLEEIIEQRRLERLDDAQQLSLLNSLREELKGEQDPGPGHRPRRARLRHLRPAAAPPREPPR